MVVNGCHVLVGLALGEDNAPTATEYCITPWKQASDVSKLCFRRILDSSPDMQNKSKTNLTYQSKEEKASTRQFRADTWRAEGRVKSPKLA